MKFNDLVALVLEGDFDPLYDTNPQTLSDLEIQNLEPQVAKKLSIEDHSKRIFIITLNNQKFKTHATSKNGAIGNIGYRLASDAKVFPNLVIYKLHKNKTKVFDEKWKIKY